MVCMSTTPQIKVLYCKSVTGLNVHTVCHMDVNRLFTTLCVFSTSDPRSDQSRRETAFKIYVITNAIHNYHLCLCFDIFNSSTH